MDELLTLSNTVAAIKRSCQEIIANAVALMRELEDDDAEDGNLVWELTTKLRDIPKKDALERLRTVSLTWTTDAETVLAELKLFVTSNGSGKIKINDDPEKCPRLTEAWRGDAYDVEGIEGLKELLKDLRSQSDLINREQLIELAAKN